MTPKLTCRKRGTHWVIRRGNTKLCTTRTYPHALRIIRNIIGANT